MPTPISILQGTLDLMILRTLAALGPKHAYAIATRLEQVSDELLKINQGTLYPALVRLEQNGWIKGTWGKTESNREAKYYAVTKAGLKELRHFQGLSELRLDGLPITDADLTDLECMPNLRFLSLWQSGVTDAGIGRLRKALPECLIVRGFIWR